METKQQVLELILNNPQTLHTLHESLDIQNNEIESILNELKEEKMIEIHEYKLKDEQKTNNIQFILLSESNSKPILSNKKLTIIKPKVKIKAHTQRRRKFKPPKLLKNKNRIECPKTTGMLHKSKSKIIGKKRKFNESNEEKENQNKKRFKCNNNNNNNKLNNNEIEEMESLKYTEQFLIGEINKLKQTNKTNTKDKKDENCLEYNKLVELTEKWTIATQEIIQSIIDCKNDPDATVPKLLQYFQINPKQVRWNIEDEEFE